jgi:ERCC4-type nuclease
MILIDGRAGSSALAHYFPPGMVEMCHLEFGDVCVPGNGPDGTQYAIGVEHKTLEDALACMDNGRLAGHQLPGMRELYDVCWLVLEGNYKAGEDGLIHVPRKGGWVPLRLGPRGGVAYAAFEHWLLTLQLQGGLLVQKTANKKDSAAWIMSLRSWWAKNWDEHKSLKTFDRSKRPGMVSRDGAILLSNVAETARGQKDVFRRVAAELPGIGWDRSKAVVQHFRSIRAMVEADEKEWKKVPGIGKKIAAAVVDVISRSKK